MWTVRRSAVVDWAGSFTKDDRASKGAGGIEKKEPSLGLDDECRRVDLVRESASGCIL